MERISSTCGGGCEDEIRYAYDFENRIFYRTGVGYGSLGYGYDKAGRLARQLWPSAEGETAGLRYAYDRAGRVRAVVNKYAGGRSPEVAAPAEARPSASRLPIVLPIVPVDAPPHRCYPPTTP